MDNLEELIPFLSLQTNRPDLKTLSIKNLLGLTSSSEGINLLVSNSKLLKCFVKLTTDDSESIRKDSCNLLVNISAESKGARLLFQNEAGIIEICMTHILNAENSPLRRLYAMILSNITREEDLAEQVLEEMLKVNLSLEKLVSCFTKLDYNKKDEELDYLAAIFNNITQSSKGRYLICGKDSRLLQRLLPFINYEKSSIRKQGIAGMLKNICFDTSLHNWLFSDDVNILPIILLPLAGPEQHDDDTNEKLPIELQYLDDDKHREEDPNVRLILLECLNQLCATREDREYLRSRGTYEILRELHKFECVKGNVKTLTACENVVDILIRTEAEIDNDNLKQLEIPNEIVEKIEKLNN